MFSSLNDCVLRALHGDRDSRLCAFSTEQCAFRACSPSLEWVCCSVGTLVCWKWAAYADKEELRGRSVSLFSRPFLLPWLGRNGRAVSCSIHNNTLHSATLEAEFPLTLLGWVSLVQTGVTNEWALPAEGAFLGSRDVLVFVGCCSKAGYGLPFCF